MRIRPATLADLDTVCDFNVRLAHESEGKSLDLAVLRPGVRAMLLDPVKGRYALAEDDGRIVGQIGVTFEWSDWRNGWFWWIQSVYVRHDARRLGVFRSLFEHLEKEAKADPQVIGIRLYVEDENLAAHATYEKLGLRGTTYRVREKYPLDV